jgi:hypothetical protein
MNLTVASKGALSSSPAFRTFWGYFQRELIFFSWSIAEVALLTPFALSFLPWARFWPPSQVAVWLLLVLLLSFNVVRLMGLLQLRQELQRNVLVIALILVILSALSILLYKPDSMLNLSWISSFVTNIGEPGNRLWTRDLGVILLTIVAWWRGVRLSVQSLSLNRAGLRLRLGGLVLAPLVIWSGRRLDWDVTPYILLFFFAAVTAVALVRTEEIERDRSGHTASLSPRWLSAVAVVNTAVVFAAGAVAALVSGDFAGNFVGWMAPIWSALYFGSAASVNVFVYLARPIFSLFSILLEWLSILLERLLASVALENITLSPIESPLASATPELIEKSEPFFDSGRIIILLLMLALVLIVSLTLRRLYYQPSPAVGKDELEMASKSGRRPPGDSLRHRLLRRLGLWQQRRAAASIRRIYQEMSDSAEACGYPRAQSETPYEYLVTLAEVWPDNTGDSQRITEAYVRIRYGELPESRAEFDAISAAWSRLKHTSPVWRTTDTAETVPRLWRDDELRG